eukprot:5901180-Amphidinium_carterae.1
MIQLGVRHDEDPVPAEHYADNDNFSDGCSSNGRDIVGCPQKFLKVCYYRLCLRRGGVEPIPRECHHSRWWRAAEHPLCLAPQEGSGPTSSNELLAGVLSRAIAMVVSKPCTKSTRKLTQVSYLVWARVTSDEHTDIDASSQISGTLERVFQTATNPSRRML